MAFAEYNIQSIRAEEALRAERARAARRTPVSRSPFDDLEDARQAIVLGCERLLGLERRLTGVSEADSVAEPINAASSCGGALGNLQKITREIDRAGKRIIDGVNAIERHLPAETISNAYPDAQGQAWFGRRTGVQEVGG